MRSIKPKHTVNYHYGVKMHCDSQFQSRTKGNKKLQQEYICPQFIAMLLVLVE